jgi:septal ring factor EnvC (AmiA/AmiB activator)
MIRLLGTDIPAPDPSFAGKALEGVAGSEHVAGTAGALYLLGACVLLIFFLVAAGLRMNAAQIKREQEHADSSQSDYREQVRAQMGTNSELESIGESLKEVADNVEALTEIIIDGTKEDRRLRKSLDRITTALNREGIIIDPDVADALRSNRALRGENDG